LRETDTFRDYQERGTMFSPVRPLISFDSRPGARADAPIHAPSRVEPGLAVSRDFVASAKPAGSAGDVGAAEATYARRITLRWLASVAGAAVVAFTFAGAVLILGTPIVLATRLVVWAIAWLAALALQ
jgi:hypothetical protein